MAPPPSPPHSVLLAKRSLVACKDTLLPSPSAPPPQDELPVKVLFERTNAGPPGGGLSSLAPPCPAAELLLKVLLSTVSAPTLPIAPPLPEEWPPVSVR